MDKQGTSSKAKFKSTFGPKLKNQLQVTQQLTDHKHRKIKIKSTLATKTDSPTRTTILSTLFSWQHCQWFALKTTFFNCYTLLYHKCYYLLDFLCKLNQYTVSSILLSLISLVKAYSTIVPSKEHLESNELVVCLPTNDSNNCTKYVNSSRNGLIELNEV